MFTLQVCSQDFFRNFTEIMREKERVKEKAKDKDKDKKAQQKKKKASDLERSGTKSGAAAYGHKQVPSHCFCLSLMNLKTEPDIHPPKTLFFISSVFIFCKQDHGFCCRRIMKVS